MCSSDLAKRSFYVIDQQINLVHPIKQNSWTKRLKRQHNKHRLFIMWCQDAFHPPTHRWYIVLFKYGMVRRWTHGICIVHLSIQTEAPPFYSFCSIDQMVMAEKDAIRNGLYALELYWMVTILDWKKAVTYIRFSAYAFGSSTFTKRQKAYVEPIFGQRTVLGGADGPRVRRIS